MSYSLEVKALAYKLDPPCWISYSGKSRDFKRAMDVRRTAALEKARVRVDRAPRGRSRPVVSRRTAWATSGARHAYLLRMAKAEGLPYSVYTKLAYCAALSQGRSSIW